MGKLKLDVADCLTFGGLLLMAGATMVSHLLLGIFLLGYILFLIGLGVLPPRSSRPRDEHE